MMLTSTLEHETNPETPSSLFLGSVVNRKDQGENGQKSVVVSLVGETDVPGVVNTFAIEQEPDHPDGPKLVNGGSGSVSDLALISSEKPWSPEDIVLGSMRGMGLPEAVIQAMLDEQVAALMKEAEKPPVQLQ